MFVVAKSSVLVVGIESKARLLREIDIDVITRKFGALAARSLKTENIQGIIARWNLPDMYDGKFFKGLKRIKPYMPTIAVIDSGNNQQEISARSLGVSAVITEGIDGSDFKRLVCNLMGFERTELIKQKLFVFEK
jgi:response regulator RpfG family c-di-GMP phosphodiesterase